jgi:tetratricopeptide (TPR) repeat protein
MERTPLGPWELDAPLGRGGSGVVYRARHARTGTPAAVKLLEPRHSAASRSMEVGPGALHTELQAVAALAHPAILRVYDHGQVDDEAEAASGGRWRSGHPYLVVELASGGALDREPPPPDWPALAEALDTILDALAHAHSRGVIHRDLKPSNLLRAAPGDLRPGLKLADFGIAALLDRDAGPVRQAGTPRFLAPEQARGDVRATGPWTDLYAVGCIAWTWATGAGPFDHDDAQTVLLRQIYEEPGSFSPRFDVPEDLEPWLRRLLRKAPEDRYRFAADARAALRALPSPRARLGAAARVTGVPPDVMAADRTTDLTLHGFLDVDAPALPPRSQHSALPVVPPPLPPFDELLARQAPAPPVVPGGLALLGLRRVPMIGRVDERRTLWEALRAVHAASLPDRTGAGQTPKVFVLRGPMGRGTSALAGWLAEVAHRLGAAEVLRATHAATPHRSDGVPAMLARALGLRDGDDADAQPTVHAHLRRHGQLHTDAAALTALIAPGAGDEIVRWSGNAERFVLLRRLMLSFTARRPALMLIEDADRGQEAVAWLRWMLHRPSAPWMAVLTARAPEEPGEHADDELDALLAHPATRVLDLPPLADEDIARIVRELAGLSPRLAAEAARFAQGEPEMVLALLTDWVSQAALVAGPDGYEAHPDLRLSAPSDLADLWRTRLDLALHDLSGPSRHALRLAALLGDTVDPRTWRAVATRLGLATPPALLGRLERAGLIEPADGGFAFAHPWVRRHLISDADELGVAAVLHRACADHLEDTPTAAGRAARLGHHRLGAGEPARALDAWIAGLQQHLAHDELHAAVALHGELVRHEHAWDLAPSDPRAGALELLAVRLAKARHRLDDARTRCRAFVARAASRGWARLRAEATAEWADTERKIGNMREALALHHDARAQFDELGDQAGVAASQRAMAAVQIQLGELTAAEALLRDARARCLRLEDTFGAAMCGCGLGDVARGRQRWAEAIAWYEHAIADLERLHHRSGLATAHHGVAEVRRLTGNLDAAEESYHQVIRLDTSLGRDNAISRLNLALCQLEREAFHRAAPTLRELQVAWAAQGRTGWLAVVMTSWLPVRADEGDWSGFTQAMDEARRLLATSGLIEMDVARMAELAADMCARAGQPDLAREAWSLALDQWRALGAGDAELRVRARMAPSRPRPTA